MTSEEKEEKTNLIYDDRRKELTQIKSKIIENKTDEVKVDGKVTEESKMVSTVNHSMNVVYTEEGIRLAHKNMKEEIKFLEGRETKLKEDIMSDEMSDELKELKEKIDLLTKYAKSEKVKTDYEAVQERLKFLKKELKQLVDKIGTRLKL